MFLVYGLGVLIQVIEISKINLSYLKFFSATQVASDSAFISLSLFIFFIVGYIYYSIITIKIKNYNFFYKEDEQPEISEYKIVGYILSLAVFICFLIFDSIEQAQDVSRLPILSIILLSLITVFFLYIAETISFTMELNKEHKYRLILSFLKWVSLPISFIMSIFVLYKCLDIYNKPYQFENYRKVSATVNERHPDVIDYDVMYFNDKYTFIALERKNPDDNTVEVYKTDAILFDETVIQVKQ